MIELLMYTAHNIVPTQNFQYQAILGKKANFVTVQCYRDIALSPSWLFPNCWQWFNLNWIYFESVI